jgi:hypothetical protein
MNASSGNVITVLRDRLLIEREILELADARSEAELSSRAQQVAIRGDQVVHAILRKLDDSDPRLLGALGAVAALYPRRDQILNKLYQAAVDESRTDRGRMVAILILERFLGQEPDPYLVATLGDPQIMATESVRGMIREGERNPFAWIEYASALSAQSEEMHHDVVETMLSVGGERATPVLCLLAQESTDSLAEESLSALGRLRHPAAVQGLLSLLPMLPAARRLLGERSLRKLQLSGVQIEPLPAVDTAWRSLLSPIDGEGNQVVWFISDADERDNCHFLGMSVSDEHGIRQAYGRHSVPAAMLPERRQIGYVHAISIEPETSGISARSAQDPADRPAPSQGAPHATVYLLETSFDHGRRRVREGQSLSFGCGHPLPAEYRLLGSLLWQYDDAGIDSDRTRIPGSASSPGLLQETANLLAHPAFRGWYLHGELVMGHAMSILEWMPAVSLEAVGQWAGVLAEDYFDETMRRQLGTRLEHMAEWLWNAGETHLAELAMVAARSLPQVSPAQHPFTRRMAEMGLGLVASQVQAQV